MKELLKHLIPIFSKYQPIKLVYFFGSRATGNEGPLSDYDFAIYLDQVDKQKMFDIKFLLADDLSRLLATDKIDIVILNLTQSPEIKYQIIKEGTLIFQKEFFKVMVEPKILDEYFDYHEMMVRHNLTQDK